MRHKWTKKYRLNVEKNEEFYLFYNLESFYFCKKEILINY